jgi:hypothetical protein
MEIALEVSLELNLILPDLLLNALCQTQAARRATRNTPICGQSLAVDAWPVLSDYAGCLSGHFELPLLWPVNEIPVGVGGDF